MWRFTREGEGAIGKPRMEMVTSLDDKTIFLSGHEQKMGDFGSRGKPLIMWAYCTLAKRQLRIRLAGDIPMFGRHSLFMLNADTLVVARYGLVDGQRSIYLLRLAAPSVFTKVVDYPKVSKKIKYIPTLLDRAHSRLLIVVPKKIQQFRVFSYTFGNHNMTMLVDVNPFVYLTLPIQPKQMALWKNTLYVFRCYNPELAEEDEDEEKEVEGYSEKPKMALIDLETNQTTLATIEPLQVAHASGPASVFQSTQFESYLQFENMCYITSRRRSWLSDTYTEYYINLDTLKMGALPKYIHFHATSTQCISNEGEMLFGVIAKDKQPPGEQPPPPPCALCAHAGLRLLALPLQVPSLKTLATRASLATIRGAHVRSELVDKCARSPVHLINLNLKCIAQYLAQLGLSWLYQIIKPFKPFVSSSSGP